MLLYQCSDCNQTFAASNPDVCPHCKCSHLKLLSNYRVNIYHTSDIQSKHNKYSVKFDIPEQYQNDEMFLTSTLCNIFQLPSISIRYSVDNPYVGRIKRCHTACDKSGFETPITVELRVYSPNRAYVLLDSESDEIVDLVSAQYKSHGWTALDLRESQISFVKAIRRFFKTHVIPRLKNDVVRKDIECIIEGDCDLGNEPDSERE